MSSNEMNMNSGVCSHSNPTIWQDYIIFEIDDHQSNCFELKLSCTQQGFGLVELEGCWKGEVNPSFILPAKEFFAGATGESIGSRFCLEQECVLHIGPPEKRARAWRDATLLYTNGKTESIGKFKQVAANVAKEQSGWTRNPNNGAYWICEF